MKRTILSLLLLVLTWSVWGQDNYATVDGVTYLPEDGTTDRCYVLACSRQLSGELTIPESVMIAGRPHTVTRIYARAFKECRMLTTINLPATLETIGEEAFCNCYSLQSVSIPDGVTAIGVCAFGGCRSLQSFTVPAGLTSVPTGFAQPNYWTYIRSDRFVNHSSFTYDASEWATFWGIYAWDDITDDGMAIYEENDQHVLLKYVGSATSVTIPEGITQVNASAFAGSMSMTEVSFPSTIQEILSKAFYDCPNLTSLFIPEGVTYVGANVVGKCTSLSSFSVPSTLERIDDYYEIQQGDHITLSPSRYFDNSMLTDASYFGILFEKEYTADGLVIYNNEVIGYTGASPNVIVPEGIVSIASSAFSPNISDPNATAPLVSISLPSTLINIGDYAFRYCTNLTSITIPANVQQIGYNAFANCIYEA